MIINYPKELSVDKKIIDRVTCEYPTYSFRVGDSIFVDEKYYVIVIQLLKENQVVGVLNVNKATNVDINKKNFPKLKTKLFSKELDLQLIYVRKTIEFIPAFREPSEYNYIGTYNIGYESYIRLGVFNPEMLWKKMIVEKGLRPNWFKVEHLEEIYHEVVMRTLANNGFFMACELGGDVYTKNVDKIIKEIETNSQYKFNSYGINFLKGWGIEFTALGRSKKKVDLSFMDGIF